MRFGLGVLLAMPLVLGAQHHHAPPGDAARDVAKLPKPVRMEGIGSAHIAITTKSAEAQQWFDQGLALLNCFWDYEALKAFEQSARLDPDCAMCHWGIGAALSFRGSDEEGAKKEFEKAKDLSAKVSDHEQRYIRADADEAEKKGDEARTAYIKELETLVDRYPDDLQAKLLLASAENGGYEGNGDPRPGTGYGQEILRNLLAHYPEDPGVNHYWIHAVEGSSRPELALDSAAKLGRLAPASGHMVHMPGHIYYRTGDYEKARAIFLESKRVDEEYMAAQHVLPRDDWNYAHNLSYLTADCAEAGRYTEAVEHARSLRGLADDPSHSGNEVFYVLQIASTEPRLNIRYGKWQEAMDHPMAFAVKDDALSAWARGDRDGLVSYARGMLAVEQGRLPEAAQAGIELDAGLWRLSKQEVPEKEQFGKEQTLKVLGVASSELQGALAARKGDYEGARKILLKAAEDEKELGYHEPPTYARPVLEVLGDVALRAGKTEDAIDAYQKELTARPKSGFALYGLARAYERAGKKEAAAQTFGEFAEAWAHADRDLPQVRDAESRGKSGTEAALR